MSHKLGTRKQSGTDGRIGLMAQPFLSVWFCDLGFRRSLKIVWRQFFPFLFLSNIYVI